MTSGYDKLAELRAKASPGPWQALTFYLVSGQTQIAEFRHSTSVGPSEQDEVLNANNAQLASLSPILAEVIGELREALERNANTIDLFRQGAVGQAALVQRFNATLEALTNTDKKLQGGAE